MVNFEKVGECLYRYSPTGMYYARFEVNKKEIRRSLRTTDKSLAKRRLKDLQNELSRLDPSAGKCTLAEMVERYLATTQSQKPVTRQRKAAIAVRLRRDFPGGIDLPISRVVTSRIKEWLNGYPFGAASYNHYLIFIRGVFAVAVEDKVLASSPVENIDCKNPAKPVRLTPTGEEFRAIVADIRAQPEHSNAINSADFVEFMGLAGLGRAEVASLKWGDIDWSREEITTFRHKTGQGFRIPIYPQLKPFLERMRVEQGGQSNAAERVFPVRNAKKALIAACKRLNLPPYTHRSFRRMFISGAIERGVDVKVIAEWQGHQDGGKLILDTYSQTRAKHRASMAKLME